MDSHSLERLDFFAVRDWIAGYCQCQLGRSLAERIEPSSRLDLIQRWLRQHDELRGYAEKHGLPPYAGISDIRGLLERCAPPLRLEVEDVAKIGDALAGTHEVTHYLGSVSGDLIELSHLRERVGDFGTIGQRIRAVIDERAQVRDNASPKLARLRAAIQSATEAIRHSVDRLLAEPETRRWLQFANYTFHGDRLVLPVKTEYRGRVAGIIHRASDSGATIYVEPAVAVELNNRVSNLRSEEAEEVNRILWELVHEIHINSQAILKTLDALAVLDLIVAKVRATRDFDLRCPEVVDEPLLAVRGARHPLLMKMMAQRAERDRGSGAVVPISYRLGEDFDLLVITGPNTGGKTVTLKTIGLLSLMVQAGLPVPVESGSRFGIFRSVLIDIGDEQSMAQSLSTFSAHLTRQMEMLRKAGPRTLVLLDELGAGTDPDEGAAIGRAMLDELLRLQCRCVATTHLGALKSFPLTRKRVENGSVEFDVQTLRPTYHLRIGEAGQSNAIAIAQRLGMPKRLVVAARRELTPQARALRAALRGAASAKREAEDARKVAEQARLDASTVRTQADETRKLLERQRADFHEWVQAVVHLRPGDPVRVRDFNRDGRIVRMRLEQHRAEVDLGAFSVEVPLGDVLPPETPAPPPRAARPAPLAAVDTRPGRREQRRARRAARPGSGGTDRRPGPGSAENRPRPHLPALTDEAARRLQPGDEIYVKRFHRSGVVIRVNLEKCVANVTVGTLELEAPFSGLTMPEQVTDEERQRAADLHRDRRARRRPPANPPGAPGSEPLAERRPGP